MSFKTPQQCNIGRITENGAVNSFDSSSLSPSSICGSSSVSRMTAEEGSPHLRRLSETVGRTLEGPTVSMPAMEEKIRHNSETTSLTWNKISLLFGWTRPNIWRLFEPVRLNSLNMFGRISPNTFPLFCRMIEQWNRCFTIHLFGRRRLNSTTTLRSKMTEQCNISSVVDRQPLNIYYNVRSSSTEHLRNWQRTHRENLNFFW